MLDSQNKQINTVKEVHGQRVGESDLLRSICESSHFSNLESGPRKEQLWLLLCWSESLCCAQQTLAKLYGRSLWTVELLKLCIEVEHHMHTRQLTLTTTHSNTSYSNVGERCMQHMWNLLNMPANKK